MTEVTGPFEPHQWDITHVTHNHGFEVGDRVVYLESLEWGDHWEFGTITGIEDVGFTALREVHTLAFIEWEHPLTQEPDSIRSREGLTPRGPFGMFPVTIGKASEHPDKNNQEA